MIPLGILTAALCARAAASEPEGYSTLLREGFRIQVESSLMTAGDALGQDALRLLEAQLVAIRGAVPEAALLRLRETPIWLDRDDPNFPCAVYHPSVDWLREHGVDTRKAKAVHLANAQNFLDWSRQQPWMVLHELAHAYHDRVLGHDHTGIRAAHARVKAAKTFANVLHVDGSRRAHYALTNPEEFFAEMTESWFGQNDFQPFVRAELVELDRETADLLRSIWEPR